MPGPSAQSAPKNTSFGFISDHPALIEFAGDSAKLKATLIGVNTGFVAVKIAGSASVKKTVAPGGLAVITLERNGVVLGFKSKILSYLQHPAQIVFLACPREIEQVNLRRQTRVECLIPIRLTSPLGEADGQMLDVSPEGCRAAVFAANGSAAPALGHGHEISIRFDAGSGEFLVVSGVVKNAGARGETQIVGVMFHKNDGRAAALAEFVDGLRDACRISCVIDEEDIGFVEAIERGDSGEGRRLSAPYAGPNRLAPGMEVYCGFAGDAALKKSSILAVDGCSFAALDYENFLNARNVPATSAGMRIVFTRESGYFSFRAPVLKFVTSPKPMVFFNCPAKLDMIEIRKSPRMGCMIPAAIDSNLMRGAVYVSDLSEGGCRLVANGADFEMIANIRPGYQLTVRLALDGSRVETVAATVRRFFSDGADIVMGLSFNESREKMAAISRAAARLCTARHAGKGAHRS